MKSFKDLKNIIAENRYMVKFEKGGSMKVREYQASSAMAAESKAKVDAQRMGMTVASVRLKEVEKKTKDDAAMDESVQEAHQEVSADFKVTPSGRKVPVQRKVRKDVEDENGDNEVKEGAVPAHMQGKQKPYVSSDGKGNFEVLGNRGQTKATFHRKDHGMNAQKMAQAHLRSKYDEYMKESVESDRHHKFNKTGAASLAKDFGEHGHVSKTKKDITVTATTHHSSFDDGSPVLKHFDQHGERKKVTIPKGSTVVHNKDTGENYAHHPEHGHINFHNDDLKKHESVELDLDNLFEAMDKEETRLIQLARLGLVDKSNVSKLRMAMDQLKSDKQLSIAQRSLLLGVLQDLVSLVTGDDQVFNRVKMDVRKEDTQLDEGENKQMKGKDPCWSGYQMVGMKDKNGKKVPNCVPKEEKEVDEGYVSLAQQRAVWATRKDGGKGHPDNKNKTKKEETELPFDGPYTKVKADVVDKSGAKHTAMSKVKHLARLALKKQQEKQKSISKPE